MIKDPIISAYTTLFISDYGDICYKLKIMPNLRTPEFNILPSNLTEYWVSQFFINSSSTQKEYIAYIIQENNAKYIQIDIYKSNGVHLHSKMLKFKGDFIHDKRNVSIQISPNGKYIFIMVKSSKLYSNNLFFKYPSVYWYFLIICNRGWS